MYILLFFQYFRARDGIGSLVNSCSYNEHYISLGTLFISICFISKSKERKIIVAQAKLEQTRAGAPLALSDELVSRCVVSNLEGA